jgi:nitrogen fixation protein
MKVILRVPDEGYSESTRWRLYWEYMMKVILRVHDEGYSESLSE